MADNSNGADRLSRNTDGAVTWDGKTWGELTERERVEMPISAIHAFRDSVLLAPGDTERDYAGEYSGEYRKPEPTVEEYERRRDAPQSRQDATYGEESRASTPDTSASAPRTTADPDDLRSRAAVGSAIWNGGKRYPFEGTDRDPERNGIAVYPEFVSEAHRFSWINGRPFAQKINGAFVNVNEGMPEATVFGYPEPGPAPTANPAPPPAAPDFEPIDWDNIPIATRAKAKERQAAEAQGQLLELFDTGGYARVKVLDILDRNSLGWVPHHLQDKLAEMLDLVEGKTGGKVVATAEAFARYQKMITDTEELADAFCVHGFIEPRLVRTERELELAGPDENVMLVTDLTKAERRSYLERCLIFDDRRARLLDPFRRKSIPFAPNQPRN